MCFRWTSRWRFFSVSSKQRSCQNKRKVYFNSRDWWLPIVTFCLWVWVWSITLLTLFLLASLDLYSHLLSKDFSLCFVWCILCQKGCISDWPSCYLAVDSSCGGGSCLSVKLEFWFRSHLLGELFAQLSFFGDQYFWRRRH